MMCMGLSEHRGFCTFSSTFFSHQNIPPLRCCHRFVVTSCCQTLLAKGLHLSFLVKTWLFSGFLLSFQWVSWLELCLEEMRFFEARYGDIDRSSGVWRDGKGGQFIFFSRQVLDFFWVPGSMLSRFSDFLLFCFSAFLLLCFSASLLFCFSAFPASCFSASAFPASLLFCFSAFCFSCFFAFLLLCFPSFSAFVLLCLSTSTILLFLFFSHVFLLLHFLLLCFFASCLYCLFVFHFLLLYSVLFVS